MTRVNFPDTGEGAYEEKPASTAKVGTQAGVGEKAAALAQRGSEDPGAYAAILLEHPDFRQGMITLLHQRFGNTFVIAVLDLVDRPSDRAATDAKNGKAVRQEGADAGRGAGATAPKTDGGTDERKTVPSVGGTVAQGLDHFDPAQLPKGERPVTNGEHRAGLIAGIKGMRDGLFSAMDKGVIDARGATQERDKPPHVEGSILLSILGEAVSAVLAGSNATAALWLANKLVPSGAKPEIEFAKNAIKEVLKDSLHSALARKSSAPRDVFPGLQQNFFTTVSREFSSRRQSLEQGWSSYSDKLSSLSDEQLQQAHSHAVNAIAAEELQARIMDIVLVSWTNFLAMVENGHKGWDFWEKNGGEGASPTNAAAPAPSKIEEDPSHGNIDPAKTGNLVFSHGSPSALPGMQSYAFDVTPSTGVLEVFCDWNGVLSNEYGMAIANVGPQVRERLVTFGQVGKLPVNKNIHIVTSDEAVGHDRVYASILVTADGYIRNVTGSAAGGAAGAKVANVVERVQKLPLSLLRE